MSRLPAWLRLALAIVAVLLGGGAITVTIDSGGNGHPAATLANGAPRPLLAAPARCVTATGQAVGATNGEMGACAPKPPLTALIRPPALLPAEPRFIDLSNNNALYGVANYRRIRAAGWRGVIVKVNQAGYVDPTAQRMVHDARAAGLRVGGYSFRDPTHTTAAGEMAVFIPQLKRLGLCTGRGVIPPTNDLEYGNITAADAQLVTSAVERACGAVQDYSGQWYANPHFGCSWPRVHGAPARGWISAYGVSDIHRYLPCGLGAGLAAWQFSSTTYNGVSTGDASVYLGSLGSWDAYTRAAPPKPKPLVPPSKWAWRRCFAANDLRHHKPHPLTRHRQARLTSHIAFFRRNHLSCYGPKVRRVR